ncbi:MAG: hypothetical protein FJ319_03125 [SAR202 cluster bacterium]|nr:hypothetical protein [SAR202 cluster bacterium]
MQRITSAARSHWPAVVPIIVLFTLAMLLFPSAGRDDGFITFWPAHTLKDDGEIVNLNGDRLEQSSSILHVVVLAAASLVAPGKAVPSVAPVVSLIAGALALLYAYALALRYVNRWLALAAGLIAATTAFFAYWSTGGLETTLAAVIFTALVYHCVRYLDAPQKGGVPIGVIVFMPLFVAVRPETVFVIGGVIAVAFSYFAWKSLTLTGPQVPFYAQTRDRLMHIGIAAAISGLVLAVFRYAYFNGDLLPQPVNGKISGSPLDYMVDGLAYAASSLVPPPLSLMPFAAIWAGIDIFIRARREDAPYVGGLFIVTFVPAYLGFIVFSGGDWMEGARFTVPLFPLIAVLAVMPLPRIKNTEMRVYAAAGMVALHVMGSIWFAKFGSSAMPIWEVGKHNQGLPVERYSWFSQANRTQLRDIATTEAMYDTMDAVRGHFSGPVPMMSGQAGFIAYHLTRDYYGDVEFIDRHALATAHFTSCEGTADLPRTNTGLFLTYAAYFANADLLQRECGIPKPAIIFELDVEELLVEKVVDEAGYTIVYRQTGKISSGSQLNGMEVIANQFIAVRDDLARHIPWETPRVMEWRP